MNTDKLKGHLIDACAGAAKSDRADARIMEEAQKQYDRVSARMDELRPQVSTKLPAADEYLRLAHERGQLALVLGRG